MLFNLFSDLPTRLSTELTTVLATSSCLRIERIVSTGHSSPKEFWYDQREHEWLAVLRGSAAIEFEDGETAYLKPGDCCMIPAHRRHRVAWTSHEEPTVWLAVFFMPE